MLQNPPITIVDQPLKGVTLRLLWAIVFSAVFTAGTVLACYYGSHEKNTIQDLQIETLRLQVQSITITLQDQQKQINQKSDK